MKLKQIMLVGLFAFGFALSANAGSVADGDSDLVPDSFDNCSAFANGPGEASNQVDSDLDGIGNACDADFTNDGLVAGTDFSDFVGFFGGTDLEGDLTGDGLVAGTDFSRFVALFGVLPGPSGLACADPTGATIPCTP